MPQRSFWTTLLAAATCALVAPRAESDALDRYFPSHRLRVVTLHSDEGTLRCVGADQDDVHLVVHGSRNGGELRLEDVEFTSRTSGDSLILDVKLRRRPYVFAVYQDALLDLSVPPELEVGAAVEDGDIEARALDGGARLLTVDGSIHAEQLTGRLEFVTRDGTIWARDLDGVLLARLRDGELDAAGRFDAVVTEAAGGRLEVKADAGSRVDPPDSKGSTPNWHLYSAGGVVRLKLPHEVDCMLVAHAARGRLDAGPYEGLRDEGVRSSLRVLLGLTHGNILVESDSGEVHLR